MNPLQRSHSPDPLSRIGGAAQGGSAKPKEERETMDRQHEQRQEDKPAAEPGTSKGTVGGTSNDSRTDQERAADASHDT